MKKTTKKHTLNPLPRNNQPTTTNIKELPLVTNPLTVVIDSKYEDKIMHLKSVPGLECFNVMLGKEQFLHSIVIFDHAFLIKHYRRC